MLNGKPPVTPVKVFVQFESTGEQTLTVQSKSVPTCQVSQARRDMIVSIDLLHEVGVAPTALVSRTVADPEGVALAPWMSRRSKLRRDTIEGSR